MTTVPADVGSVAPTVAEGTLAAEGAAERLTFGNELAPLALAICAGLTGTIAAAGLVTTGGATDTARDACTSGVALAGVTPLDGDCVSIFGADFGAGATLTVEGVVVAVEIEGSGAAVAIVAIDEAATCGELLVPLVVCRTSAATVGTAAFDDGDVVTFEDAGTVVATALFDVPALTGAAATFASDGWVDSVFFGAVKFETVEGRSSNIIPSPDFRFFSLTTGAAATELGSGIC